MRISVLFHSSRLLIHGYCDCVSSPLLAVCESACLVGRCCLVHSCSSLMQTLMRMCDRSLVPFVGGTRNRRNIQSLPYMLIRKRSIEFLLGNSVLGWEVRLLVAFLAHLRLCIELCLLPFCC